MLLATVAVPSAVANCTVTVAVVAEDRLTVKTKLVAVFGEVPTKCCTLLIETAGTTGGLTIVPVAEAVVIAALVEFDRLTVNVSFGLNVELPFTATVTFSLVVPGEKVNVPLVAM